MPYDLSGCRYFPLHFGSGHGDFTLFEDEDDLFPSPKTNDGSKIPGEVVKIGSPEKSLPVIHKTSDYGKLSKESKKNLLVARLIQAAISMAIRKHKELFELFLKSQANDDADRRKSKFDLENSGIQEVQAAPLFDFNDILQAIAEEQQDIKRKRKMKLRGRGVSREKSFGENPAPFGVFLKPRMLGSRKSMTYLFKANRETQPKYVNLPVQYAEVTELGSDEDDSDYDIDAMDTLATELINYDMENPIENEEEPVPVEKDLPPKKEDGILSKMFSEGQSPMMKKILNAIPDVIFEAIEGDLMHNLARHAERIAKTVLAKPGNGKILNKDVRLALDMWTKFLLEPIPQPPKKAKVHVPKSPPVHSPSEGGRPVPKTFMKTKDHSPVQVATKTTKQPQPFDFSKNLDSIPTSSPKSERKIVTKEFKGAFDSNGSPSSEHKQPKPPSGMKTTHRGNTRRVEKSGGASSSGVSRGDSYLPDENKTSSSMHKKVPVPDLIISGGETSPKVHSEGGSRRSSDSKKPQSRDSQLGSEFSADGARLSSSGTDAADAEGLTRSIRRSIPFSGLLTDQPGDGGDAAGEVPEESMASVPTEIKGSRDQYLQVPKQLQPQPSDASTVREDLDSKASATGDEAETEYDEDEEYYDETETATEIDGEDSLDGVRTKRRKKKKPGDKVSTLESRDKTEKKHTRKGHQPVSREHSLIGTVIKEEDGDGGERKSKSRHAKKQPLGKTLSTSKEPLKKKLSRNSSDVSVVMPDDQSEEHGDGHAKLSKKKSKAPVEKKDKKKKPFVAGKADEPKAVFMDFNEKDKKKKKKKEKKKKEVEEQVIELADGEIVRIPIGDAAEETEEESEESSRSDDERLAIEGAVDIKVNFKRGKKEKTSSKPVKRPSKKEVKEETPQSEVEELPLEPVAEDPVLIPAAPPSKPSKQSTLESELSFIFVPNEPTVGPENEEEEEGWDEEDDGSYEEEEDEDEEEVGGVPKIMRTGPTREEMAKRKRELVEAKRRERQALQEEQRQKAEEDAEKRLRIQREIEMEAKAIEEAARAEYNMKLEERMVAQQEEEERQKEEERKRLYAEFLADQEKHAFDNFKSKFQDELRRRRSKLGFLCL